MSLTPLRSLRMAGIFFGGVVAANAFAASAETSAARENTAPTHDERMAWFRQAKFGLFIHWGLYAIPAGEWKGQRSPGIGEWVMNRMQIPVKEYEQLAPKFNPTQFDAEAWVQMAVDAGMKYIVITAKHHDGFAMYHSHVSAFNIFDATPFKRDPIEELAAACAKHGMPFGFYYSQAQDWHEPGGAGNNWDFPTNEAKDKSGAYDRYLREKAEPQVRELLQNYGPICLIWFDTPQLITKERGDLFANAVHTEQPKTLIDGRLGPLTPGDYESTGDNAIPPSDKAGDWEVPATINHTWGFRKDDEDWKSPGEILFKLVDIASKGGNYLLNVGPTSDGIIPAASQANLRTAGRWLKVNGEAIYGASRSPFGEEFGDFGAKLKDAAGKAVFLARSEWRCTTKIGKVYFTLFKVSSDRFVLPAFQNEITTAYLLEDAKRTPLEVQKRPDGIRTVKVPRMAVNDTMGAVLVLEIEGESVRR